MWRRAYEKYGSEEKTRNANGLRFHTKEKSRRGQTDRRDCIEDYAGKREERKRERKNLAEGSRERWERQ